MPQFVQMAVAQGIAAISINRPELHNAFNEVVIAELTEAMNSASQSQDVRVVVLRGEGKSFCAGADVNWMKRMIDYSYEENVADATAMADMLAAIRKCQKPVIARVHGAAIGGGVGLTAACDMAVAVKSALFCLSEVKLGILPAVISPYVMEKMGPGPMRRYALTAEKFDAAEAHRLGLVSHVVEDEAQLDAWIAATAKAIMDNGPEALAACKRVLADVQEQQTSAGKQQLTVERISKQRVTPEGQDGLKSFLEKRKPNWIQ
ncbi:MAG: enoyl-CoA hydratase/isomerase family protein [Planctomycetes bacterium]|nr:enoyl-CoA hydratase/isomerase family protein [Planctomycetota bacterium]